MTTGTAGGAEAEQWRDEAEQLRTALEVALEENAGLIEDRALLLDRVAALSRELQSARDRYERARPVEAPPVPMPGAQAPANQDPGDQDPGHQAPDDQGGEELRVAFEELQVLTEELEVSNAALHESNRELDGRVEHRTAQLRLANIALRASDASFKAAANLVPDLLWRADGEGNATWFNDRWFQHSGQIASEPIGLGWLDVLHPVERQAAKAAWLQAARGGQDFRRELRLRGAAGGYRWFAIHATPQTDELGQITQWFAAGTDIHEGRIILEALQRSESRFRSLVEGMAPLVWRAIGDGRWTWSSPQWTAATGLTEAQSAGLGWLEAVHPDDREGAVAAWGKASRAGRLGFDARLRGGAGYRWHQTTAMPVRNEAGDIVEWLGASTDVDDLRTLQERQQVLVAELQHRVRNILTVVRSVFNRTADGGPDLEDVVNHFRGRLDALARAQVIVTRNAAGTADLEDLVREELLSVGVSDGANTVIEGPDVILTSTAAESMGLAIHELTTNALKYGALKVPDASLTVRWTIDLVDGAPPHVNLEWWEQGVPAVSIAPREGFGRELIERALPYRLGAHTKLEFLGGGVRCLISLPLTEGLDGLGAQQEVE